MDYVNNELIGMKEIPKNKIKAYKNTRNNL